MDTPITKNEDGTYNVTIYTRDNNRNLILLRSAYDDLKKRFDRGRLFGVLDPMPVKIDTDPRLRYGAASQYYSIASEDIDAELVAFKEIAAFAVSNQNLFSLEPAHIGARVIEMEMEEDDSVIQKITGKINLIGAQRETIQQLIDKYQVKLALNPRCIVGAYNTDARSRYIHFLIGLYFVQLKKE
jgi:hypothetical protein